MNWLRTTYQRHPKLWLTGAVLILVLVAVRIAAPAFILKRLNTKLATMSPVYSLHVGNLHLSFIRMFYRLENLEGRLKNGGKIFASAERIDVSVAWSQLFRGRILTNVIADNGRIVLSPALFEESKQPQAAPKAVAQQAAATLCPMSVSAIRIQNASLEFGDYLNEPGSNIWRVTGVGGTVTNLNPTPAAPFTYFTARGTMLQSSMFKASGRARRLDKPMAWEAQTEVRGFDLVQTNKLVSRFFPLTFTSGTLDLFAEAKSQHGKVEGYVKPFIKKMHVIGDKKDFKSIEHFAVEMAIALGNAVLRRPEDQSVATRLEFIPRREN